RRFGASGTPAAVAAFFGAARGPALLCLLLCRRPPAALALRLRGRRAHSLPLRLRARAAAVPSVRILGHFFGEQLLLRLARGRLPHARGPSSRIGPEQDFSDRPRRRIWALRLHFSTRPSAEYLQ